MLETTVNMQNFGGNQVYYGLTGLCENGHYENRLDYAH